MENNLYGGVLLKKRANIAEQSVLEYWLPCFAIGLLLFYNLFQSSLFNALNQNLIVKYQFSATQLSQLSSLFFWGISLALIPVGYLCQHYKIRKLLLFAAVLSVLSVFMMAFVPMLSAQIIARLLLAVANAFIFLGGIALITEIYKVGKRKTTAIGVFMAIGNSGCIFAAGPFLLALEKYGWNLTFTVNMAVGCFVLALAYVFVPYNKVSEKQTQKKSNLLEAFRNSNNWCIGLIIGVFMLPPMVVGGLWGNTFLEQYYGLSRVLAGNIISLYWIGILVTGPLCGSIIDRINSRQKYIFLNLVAMFSMLILLALGKGIFGSIAIIGTLFVLLALIAGGDLIAYDRIDIVNSKRNSKLAISIVMITANVIAALGQIGFGWILDRDADHSSIDTIGLIYSKSSLEVPIILLGVVFSLVFLLTYKMRKEKCTTN